MNTFESTFKQYAFKYAHSDEALQADGEVKPNWRYLLDGFASLGSEGIAERQSKASRILRDDGATYNLYDHGKRERSWSLDLLPFQLESKEWLGIEAGLQERAELFNLIHSDIYGQRELITRGILPPELVFGHTSFLRACDGLKLPGIQQLIIHGVDMVRQSDGSMCVLSDRVQAPSGLGYALENRTVMSRVLPSLFRESDVHRLSSFFHVLRQKLVNLAPDVASPRIVVLTPGPYNETYFEHAFLANYLGFSLVQSDDLVVSQGYVWMRTPKGLNRVDVILRRVDELYCDPVELKADSQLGVSGLLQVARAGNIAIANPLGSGFMENPVLYRFLPRISQHFLGRNLRLDYAKTWWCGDKDDYSYVLENFNDLIIKAVMRRSGARVNTLVVSNLGDERAAKLLAAVKAQPEHFVAQEKRVPSHVPSLRRQQLVSRPIILRSFAVAAEDASYRVMPGGLSRIGMQENSLMIANHLGSISKDTWVMASEPEKPENLLPQPGGQESFSEVAELPSRIVENLFWMGRYMERAECGLRLIRTLFVQFNGITQLPETTKNLLLQSVTQLTSTYPGFVSDLSLLDHPDDELMSVLLDQDRIGSISHAIHSLLASADHLQGLLSSDSQRIINDISDQIDRLGSSLNAEFLSSPEETLDQLISSLLALAGIVNESMIRDTGWLFVVLGRRIERASQTAILIRSLLFVGFGEREERILLESLGMTIESIISYRRRFGGALKLDNMLTLILMDTSSPRSLAYQIKNIVQSINDLPGEQDQTEISTHLRHMMEADSQLELSRVDQLSSVDEVSNVRSNLDQLCARVQYLLSETSNALSKEYFDHTQEARQLVGHSESTD